MAEESVTSSSSTLTARLLAFQISADRPFEDACGTLSRLGMSYAEIAVVLGTTSGSVRAAASRHRKRQENKDGI